MIQGIYFITTISLVPILDWGKLDKALDYLEQGVKSGIVKECELTKQRLDEDPDFKNLRASNDCQN
jgi:hypothetical protein